MCSDVWMPVNPETCVHVDFSLELVAWTRVANGDVNVALLRQLQHPDPDWGLLLMTHRYVCSSFHTAHRSWKQNQRTGGENIFVHTLYPFARLQASVIHACKNFCLLWAHTHTHITYSAACWHSSSLASLSAPKSPHSKQTSPPLSAGNTFTHIQTHSSIPLVYPLCSSLK